MKRLLKKLIAVVLTISFTSTGILGTSVDEEKVYQVINGELIEVNEDEVVIDSNSIDFSRWEYNPKGELVPIENDEEKLNFEMTEVVKDNNLSLLSTEGNGTITASTANTQLILSKDSNILPNETIHLVSNVSGQRVKSYKVKYYKGSTLLKTLSYTGNEFVVPKTVDISSTTYTTSQQITLNANTPYRVEASGGNNVATWDAKWDDLYGAKECTSSIGCIWDSYYYSSGYGYKVSADVHYTTNQVLDLAIGTGSAPYHLSAWVYEGAMTAEFKSTQARNQTLLVGAGGANNSLSKSGKGSLQSAGLYSGKNSRGYANVSAYDVDDGVSAYGANQTSNAKRYQGSGSVTVDNTIVGWYDGGEVSGVGHLGQGYVSTLNCTSGASSYIKGTTYKAYADGSGEPTGNTYDPIFQYGYASSSSATPYVKVTTLSYYDSVVIEPTFETFTETGDTTITSTTTTKGKVLATRTLAAMNELVAFVVTPEYGFKLKSGSIKVKDANGNVLLTLADDATTFNVPYTDMYYEFYKNGTLKPITTKKTCDGSCTSYMCIESAYTNSSNVLTGTYTKGNNYKSAQPYMYFTDPVDVTYYDTLVVNAGAYGGTPYSSSYGPIVGFTSAISTSDTDRGTGFTGIDIKSDTVNSIDITSYTGTKYLTLGASEKTDGFSKKTVTQKYTEIYMTGRKPYTEIMVTAEFEPDIANYTVKHYVEQLDGTYKLYSTETKSGVIDSTLTLADVKKVITGFIEEIMSKAGA